MWVFGYKSHAYLDQYLLANRTEAAVKSVKLVRWALAPQNFDTALPTTGIELLLQHDLSSAFDILDTSNLLRRL